MFDKKKLKLYAITDRNYIFNNNYTIESAVEYAILGGATIVQIREKKLNNNEFLKEVLSVKKITSKYNVHLIVNDNVEVAIKSDADGIHLGQEDLIGKDIKILRKEFGENKIIGISADTLEEAIIAEKNGADYIGTTSPFTNSKISNHTKPDAKINSFEEIEKILNNVKIPCVMIGGIKKQTIPLFKDLKVSGFAMISAIFDNKDIKKETNEILQIINNII